MDKPRGALLWGRLRWAASSTAMLQRPALKRFTPPWAAAARPLAAEYVFSVPSSYTSVKWLISDSGIFRGVGPMDINLKPPPRAPEATFGPPPPGAALWLHRRPRPRSSAVWSSAVALAVHLIFSNPMFPSAPRGQAMSLRSSGVPQNNCSNNLKMDPERAHGPGVR